jgi:GntR family transcriptional regulator, transcriptional repressor for pyruvate dehydrogenase complex
MMPAAMLDKPAASDPIDDLLAGADVAPTRLGRAVVEKLTEAILDGRLKPGDPLPSEGRIALAFGVSKPIVREAVRDLAAMGVVQIQQGKVARVRSLDAEPLGRFYRFAVRGSKEGLAEAVELRRILEPAIARLAAANAHPEGVARLAAVLARMEAALQDIPAWIEADLDFHETLADLSGNRLLRLQVRGLRPVLSEIMALFNARRQRVEPEWRRTYERHLAVLRAVEAGDPGAAESAMVLHFEAAEGAIREIFPRDD